jgi:hypothetical protein
LFPAIPGFNGPPIYDIGPANNEDTHPGLRAFYNNPACPHCGDILQQANCVVSKPLENAGKSTVVGAAATAFKGGVSNAAGWGEFLPEAWNAVKSGTVTAGAALWMYGKIMYDTGHYMISGCPSE